jgi:hypothetical protein
MYKMSRAVCRTWLSDWCKCGTSVSVDHFRTVFILRFASQHVVVDDALVQVGKEGLSSTTSALSHNTLYCAIISAQHLNRYNTN